MEEDDRRMLAAALDLGINVFDTADAYGQGDSERELGRALRGRRGDAFVVTKLGALLSRRVRNGRLTLIFIHCRTPVLTSSACRDAAAEFFEVEEQVHMCVRLLRGLGGFEHGEAFAVRGQIVC